MSDGPWSDNTSQQILKQQIRKSLLEAKPFSELLRLVGNERVEHLDDACRFPERCHEEMREVVKVQLIKRTFYDEFIRSLNPRREILRNLASPVRKHHPHRTPSWVSIAKRL